MYGATTIAVGGKAFRSGWKTSWKICESRCRLEVVKKQRVSDNFCLPQANVNVIVDRLASWKIPKTIKGCGFSWVLSSWSP